MLFIEEKAKIEREKSRKEWAVWWSARGWFYDNRRLDLYFVANKCVTMFHLLSHRPQDGCGENESPSAFSIASARTGLATAGIASFSAPTMRERVKN